MRRPLPRPGGDRKNEMFLEKLLYILGFIICLLCLVCVICAVGYFTIIF